jgi:tRNA nucleotidyltransferase/poly(A) polymerase
MLHKIPEQKLEGALYVVNTLRDQGFKTLLAGGAVRDLLLGRTVRDIDIATSATPEEIEGIFPRTVAVGKAYGVIRVMYGSIEYEVATFRADLGYEDGRRPTAVRYVEDREDALRRDFTVNALFLDPSDNRLIDYIEGKEDLEARIIKAVGDPEVRFKEDKLRMLRAVRFAVELDFQIDGPTADAIKKQAGEILCVSWERIRDELLKILTSPAPDRGLDLLDEFGLLDRILPEVSAMKGVEQPPQFHPEGDVFVHTRLMLTLSKGSISPVLAMGILLHDVGKPPVFKIRERIRFDGHAEVGADMTLKICERLRMSSHETRCIVSLVKDHLRFIPVHQMKESTLKRFLRMEDFDLHMALHRLDCLASHGDLSNYLFCEEKLEHYSKEEVKPEALIKGQDLIDLGLKPGPLFSEILEKVEDLQLERQLGTREAALEFVEKEFRPGK